MDRKKFVKDSMLGLGAIIAAPLILGSCEKKTVTPDPNPTPSTNPDPNCTIYPSEVKGPYPIKTPADWIRENIVGDRTGIPLHIIFTIENVNNSCNPLADAQVDLWHCDAQGNYSEYANQVDGDFTSQHFLRGRQTTDANGMVSFMTIYPGWYPGRAPHTHIEIKKDGQSLLVSQTSFPEAVSNEVYATADYNGTFDTSNAQDGTFNDGIEDNMPTSVIGNVIDGYTLRETIKVSA